MNSTTKIIAGVAVLALLFAGIGYAVTYTADTSSEGNTVGVAYIQLNKGQGEAKIIGANSNIGFDTETAGGVVTYKAKAGDLNAGHIYLSGENVSAGVTITLTDEAGLIDATRFTAAVSAGTATISGSGAVWTISGATAGTEATPTDIQVTFSVIADASFTETEKAALASPGVTFAIHAEAEVD